jgi:hypothetical protein
MATKNETLSRTSLNTQGRYKIVIHTYDVYYGSYCYFSATSHIDSYSLMFLFHVF